MSTDETKKKILEAALQEFSMYGFFGSRTANIAKRAGKSKTMLHYHFNTKEDLFEAVLNKVINDLLLKLQQKTKIGAFNLQFMIESIVTFLIDSFSEKPYLVHFLYQINNQTPNALLASKFGQNDQIVFIMKAIITEAKGKNSKLPKTLDAEHLFINIVGLCTAPFLAKNYIISQTNRSEEQYKYFVQEHKTIVIDLIQRQLNHI